jgi:hypothetical protein
MDRKIFSIATLSLTAMTLFVACLFPNRPANADFAVKDLRGMQMVTVNANQGGDVLFVIEPQSSKIVILKWDANRRDLRPVAVGDLNKAFTGGK